MEKFDKKSLIDILVKYHRGMGERQTQTKDPVTALGREGLSPSVSDQEEGQ